MKYDKRLSSRRKFLQNSSILFAGALAAKAAAGNALNRTHLRQTKVNGHLWVYASKFPPDWDVTPDLETVFAELSYAGIDGVELMESTLRYDDSVSRINRFISKYKLPVAGTSYGVGLNMWDVNHHQKIWDDAKIILPRLSQLKGKRLGISVGEAKRIKTEQELDAQAEILRKILAVCDDNGIEANLHNHTYEVTNNLHDLKGTLARIPHIKLGPDLNWLIRAGINPVEFIKTYGKQITYLHIRDQYADGKWTEYVGQGVTDFPAIAKALGEQKFDGDVAIELAFPADLKPANLLKDDWKISREYVRKTFGW